MTRFTLLSRVLAYSSSWFRWSPADLGPAQLLLMWTRWSSCCVCITHEHLDVVLPTLPASVPHNHLLTSLDQGFILFGHECDEAISISTSAVNNRHSLRPNKDCSLLFWMNLLSERISLSFILLSKIDYSANKYSTGCEEAFHWLNLLNDEESVTLTFHWDESK